MATSTLGSGTLVLAGTTSGTTTVTATAVAGTTTLTLPAATDTLVGKATTDTLTNKTLTGAVMNGTLGATTPSTGAFTTLSATGTISKINTAATTSQAFGSTGSTTGGTYGSFINTGGDFYFGIENSAGSAVLSGATAYSAVLSTTTATSLHIGTGNVVRATFSSAGLAVTGLTDISAATSGQIKFTANQNASSDANTLDDYEEGTWTPVFNGSTTNPTQTSGTAAGAYIKVGKLVWVSIQMAGITYTGGSGNLLIAGLPFAASTANGELVSFYETTNTFPVGKTGLWGYTSNSATNLNLAYAGGTAGSSTVLVSTASSWNMYTTFCYRATA